MSANNQPNETHVGPGYTGSDESAAQVAFAMHLVEGTIKSVVAQERADRIRQQGIEQTQLLGWRQSPAATRTRIRRPGCRSIALASIIALATFYIVVTVWH